METLGGPPRDYHGRIVSRARKAGRLSACDAEMLGALFDPGMRESALSQLRQADDPVPAGFRRSLADSIDQLLLPHAQQFIERVHASGRGINAVEFDAAVQLVAQLKRGAHQLRVAEGGLMSATEAAELAASLEAAWYRFMAEAAAHRMYHDLVEADASRSRNLTTGNSARRNSADDDLLAKFSRWQAQRRASLIIDGQPMSPDECVRRYLQKMRPTDRVRRRLNRLLKERRVPTL